MHLAHIDRFNSHVEVHEHPGGCHVWTAAVATRGYPQFWDGSRRVQAHRWIYEQRVGPIPDGLQVDHRCRNRRCVNPYHLEPVTGSENVRRGFSARGPKRFCKRGHEFTPENTYIFPKRQSKECRTCRQEIYLPRRKSSK